MQGDKGRLDFWNNQDFARNPTIERGIYPKKNLHLLLDAGVVEKFKIKNKVRWRLVDGAFFRMSDGREITWHTEEPEVVKVEPIKLEVVDAADPILEVENEYDYLEKAKEIMDEPKKKKGWFIKWR